MSFGTEDPASVHCFDYCLNSGIEGSIQLSSISINLRENRWIFVTQLQSMLWHRHLVAFLLRSKDARHPSCTELVHVQFVLQDVTRIPRRCQQPRQFGTTSLSCLPKPLCIWSINSGVVALFGCPLLGLSSMLSLPHLNAAAPSCLWSIKVNFATKYLQSFTQFHLVNLLLQRILWLQGTQASRYLVVLHSASTLFNCQNQTTDRH